MVEHGYRDDTIDDYFKAIRLFLTTSRTLTPSVEDAREYHANMAASNLARATVNIGRAALIAFYKSQGLELRLLYLKPNNQVPYSLMKMMWHQFSIRVRTPSITLCLT
jgi:hypothetical protein